jgi:glycosyl transferase-like sugar-binding protein
MVPNIFHFIFFTNKQFGGKPFSFSHYMAIKSAIVVNNPTDVMFHYEDEPSGEYWDKIKGYLSLNKVQAPEAIHGNKIYYVTHQSDIIRLQALYKHGGIYMDTDTISVKPLDPFRKYPFSIGQELQLPVEYTLLQKTKKIIKHTTLRPLRTNINGLCGAVILSEPGAPFIEHWYDSYKTFRSKGTDEFFGEHPVLKPYELSKKYPELIHKISPYSFHYPLYDEFGLKLLFEKKYSFPKAYIHHLWESMSWEKYLKDMTPEYVKSVDTTYNLIARKFL